MDVLLWILAVVLVIGGITRLMAGNLPQGIGFLIVAALVGPGGVSLLG